MAAPFLGRALAWPYRATLAGLYRMRVKPWQLTVAALLTTVVVGWLLVRGERLVPGLLLMAAGLLDVFDGGLARLRGEESRRGAFLDSVFDRVSDAIVFSCLFWSLSGQGKWPQAGLSLVVLGVSLGVSQVRAEGEAVGVSMSAGVFQRLERVVAMVIGLCVPYALLPVLALLAVLGTVTLLQRIVGFVRGGGRLAEIPPPPPPPRMPFVGEGRG